jgi:hypothetical protein
MQPDVTKVVTPFEYRAHDDIASDVALAGEWTAWSPVPMNRVGNGTWALDVILPAGPHHFKFVVDSNWCTSQMYDTADDGQGGLNNVRLVSPDGPKDNTLAPVPMHNGDTTPTTTEKTCRTNGPDQPQSEKSQDQANCLIM